MQFTDAVTVAGTRRRDDGYLVADARIAHTGIQNYLGSEVGKPDMAQVRVHRPGSEVFSDETLRSAAHRPVTNDHPDAHVNSKNWKDYAVGQTGDEVTGEGIFIRVPLMVSDERAISDIEAGKQKLSAGYTCDLDFIAGTTPSGEAYDAIQKNIILSCFFFYTGFATAQDITAILATRSGMPYEPQPQQYYQQTTTTAPVDPSMPVTTTTTVSPQPPSDEPVLDGPGPGARP